MSLLTHFAARVAANQAMSIFPDRPFEAYRPSAGEPWGTLRIGHLLRRTSFGGRPDEFDAAESSGPAAAVDQLFDFDPADDPFNDLFERAAEVFRLDNHRRVQEWWIYRMQRTDRPLQEKIALFWHNHFATGGSKVRHDRMHEQIELFRQKGLGSFRELLLEVGRQPAMLLWLDGNNSHKQGPNENYAREVMELFTLGVDQGYTEADIKELARAFTGWQARGSQGRFDKGRFDDGEKTILGETGHYTDEQAIDLLLATNQAPRFIAAKLLRGFVHPEPPADAVEHYAKRLQHHDWHIGKVLKEMLKSRMFLSPWAWRSMIKDPVTLTIGATRALGGTIKAEFVREYMGKMGQSLLFPPDVSGWTGGKAWLNAATILVRYQFALETSRQSGRWYVQGENLGRLLNENQSTEPEAIVDFYTDLLLDGQLPPSLRGRLVDYMRRDDKNQPTEDWKLNGDRIRKKVKGMLHLMMCSPQFQLA
jgi:hypothetical protein